MSAKRNPQIEINNPFTGLDAEGRLAVWEQLLSGEKQAGKYPPSAAAYERLQRTGETASAFNMRLAAFGFRHGWHGGLPASAAAFIEGERLVDAFNSFAFGSVQLDLSHLPGDESGNIIL